MKERKSPIRLKGLIAFVIIILVISVFWLLVIDCVVKREIERNGTDAVGAKVELKSADLSLFPMGLTLTGLQVTNPESPMQNSVEIERISFSIDGARLLGRKVLVEEMEVTGVRFNTTRSRSGAIRKTAATGKTSGSEKKAGKLPTDLFKLPDPKEILKGADLPSLALVEKLKADLNSAETKWQEKFKELPGKKEFDEYKERFDKLKATQGGGGLEALLGGAAGFAELQKDIQNDLDKIKSAQKEIDSITSGFKSRISAAAKAPEQDLKRIMKKYTLSPDSLSNLGSALLGQKAGTYIETALKWNKRLAPVIERVKERRGNAEVIRHPRKRGVTVRFKDKTPTPDILIRTLNFSVLTAQGEFAGKVTDITPDAEIHGRPMRLSVDATEVDWADKIKIDGTIDRTAPTAPIDTVTASIKGAKIESISLSESEEFPISINSAVAQLKMKANMSGEVIKANADISLKELKLDRGKTPETGKEKNALGKGLSSALSSINELKIGIEVSGTREKYAVKITSGLDSLLKGIVENQMKAQVATFENELRKEIEAKTAGPLKGLDTSLGPLQDISGLLSGQLGFGNELLKQPSSSTPGKPASPLPFKLPF